MVERRQAGSTLAHSPSLAIRVQDRPAGALPTFWLHAGGNLTGCRAAFEGLRSDSPCEPVNELRHSLRRQDNDSRQSQGPPAASEMGWRVQSVHCPCFVRAPLPHDEAARVMTLPMKTAAAETASWLHTASLCAVVRVPAVTTSLAAWPRAQPGACWRIASAGAG